MLPVFIGIGSNIKPEENLVTCADALTKHWPKIIFSPVYRTAAREVEDQADFLNAVALITTKQTPEEIHTILKQIETDLGKNPPERFGPRTIDLDLLLYGNQVIEKEGLVIPHPRMHQRRFVLEPLCQLIDIKREHPALNLPWETLLQATKDQSCTQLDWSL